MQQLDVSALWSVAAVVALIIGVGIIVYGFRASNNKASANSFDQIGGVLKQDWTRTGRIDFYVGTLQSTSPQALLLRVEEKKIVENAMGEDVIQLRWRLGTVDEAKEVVACWNAHGYAAARELKSDRGDSPA
jgi:hypothetical protein